MAAGEVDLKEKSGTAWSHSYLNQKPWHPLSYPNQRRKWIAEQIMPQVVRTPGTGANVNRAHAQHGTRLVHCLCFDVLLMSQLMVVRVREA
ncbi:hypothetical protein ACJX0J_042130, partial [Zea mays]